MNFPKGTKLYWKKDNTPAYEKLSDDEWSWWVSLDSKYLKEVTDNTDTKEKIYELRPESEKPLYKNNGDLNRFGFRWTDNQVCKEYSGYMLFEFNLKENI